jgi:uncharacterized cupredoxin-like copper-binding protein
MRVRRLGMAGGVLLAAIITAGCASRGASPPPAETGDGSQPPRVGVVMREFEFEPRPLKVTAGKVTFVLMNRGSVDHDFAIPSLEGHDAHDQHLVKPGKTATVELMMKAGTYEAICTIPGHREAGMHVTIEVSP